MSKLTDTEILKALECCVSDDINSCDDCPFFEQCENYQRIEEIALDLINRQKAEIERLREGIKFEREIVDNIPNLLLQAQSEARKEFAERLLTENGTMDKRIISAERVKNLLEEMEGE